MFMMWAPANLARLVGWFLALMDSTCRAFVWRHARRLPGDARAPDALPKWWLGESETPPVAIVTGAGSGIGFATAKRCVEEAGYGFDHVLDAGETLAVRKTANLHTGGTIHDVTAELHPALAEAARAGARALEIPVVGFDFLVPSVSGPDYVIIEANERPGLANHEPQPTAERFVDMLFPQTVAPGGSPRPPAQADRPNEVSAW